MTQHWHVGTGLSGYGPTPDVDHSFAGDPVSLADLIHTELETHVDRAHEMITITGDKAQTLEAQGWPEHAASLFREAYSWFQVSELLWTLRQTFSDRSQAPLYRDNRAAWENTIMRLVQDHMPCSLDPDGSVLLYVWTCTETECEEGQ